MSVPFVPLSNYIVITIVQKETSKIIRPDTIKVPLTAEDTENVVVAVSADVDNEGRSLVRNVCVGDKVLLDAQVIHTGQAVVLNKKEYVIVRENNVIGIMYDEVDTEQAVN